MSKIAKGTPTKEFFVGMLTRDIELSDAILDLLDNCLDGVVRQKKTLISAVQQIIMRTIIHTLLLTIILSPLKITAEAYL